MLCNIFNRKILYKVNNGNDTICVGDDVCGMNANSTCSELYHCYSNDPCSMADDVGSLVCLIFHLKY